MRNMQKETTLNIQAQGPRRPLSLDGEWEIALDENNCGFDEG